MVARGDLGVELELERVPFAQKLLIRKAKAPKKRKLGWCQVIFPYLLNPFWERPTRNTMGYEMLWVRSWSYFLGWLPHKASPQSSGLSIFFLARGGDDNFYIMFSDVFSGCLDMHEGAWVSTQDMSGNVRDFVTEARHVLIRVLLPVCIDRMLASLSSMLPRWWRACLSADKKWMNLRWSTVLLLHIMLDLGHQLFDWISSFVSSLIPEFASINFWKSTHFLANPAQREPANPKQHPRLAGP